MEDLFDKIMREACEEVDREQAEKKAKEQEVCGLHIVMIDTPFGIMVICEELN